MPFVAGEGAGFGQRLHRGVWDGEPGGVGAGVEFGVTLLSLLLDTDDGRGIVIKESDEVGGILLTICTITVTRNPAARRNGRSRRCRGPWFIGGATDRRSSARS